MVCETHGTGTNDFRFRWYISCVGCCAGGLRCRRQRKKNVYFWTSFFFLGIEEEEEQLGAGKWVRWCWRLPLISHNDFYFHIFFSFWVVLIVFGYFMLYNTERKLNFSLFYRVDRVRRNDQIWKKKKKKIGISPFPYYEIKRKNKKQETECFLSDWVPTGGNKS